MLGLKFMNTLAQRRILALPKKYVAMAASIILITFLAKCSIKAAPTLI